MGLPWLNQAFQFIAFGRYNSTPPVVGNGVAGELQTDASGNLLVNIAGSGGAVSPAWVDTTALTYQQVVRAASARLFSFIGSNEGASRRWLQFFNATAVPSNTAIPVFSFPVAATTSFLISLERGRMFSTGLVWAVSSTAATLTIDAAATFWVNTEIV